ncbi:MFS transporter [Tsukamurella sp. 8F]|uniref:MFS transporter n=1 Tax=unclassified Tsukamurella TaxID=2633480 RepID=UPI0023BA3881|nr:MULTISPECIES: MFS transporter [unclassified Tsukamurella]MDF0529547.1 MFS transporter [Tsukamurella sp. 8J]MDF0585765.1 MFS transporter [Tsukamurella sp. 8F]
MGVGEQERAAADGAVAPVRRYAALGGSWAAWLFDAVDAAVFSFVILAVSHAFGATLADVVSSVAWFLLATGIGGYLLGYLADRIGRRATLVVSVLTYATGTLMCGFADSVGELSMYRILVGIGVGGLWSAAVALVGETWPPHARTRAIAVLQTGWSGGTLLAAVLAWNVLDPADPSSWRRLFVVAAVPAYIIALVIAVTVRESPVWLESRRNRSAATASVSPMAIFAPAQRRTTLRALGVSVLGMFGYWIIITFTPTYLQSVLHVKVDQAPVFLVWTGVGATLGYLLYGVLAERVGKRRAFIVFFTGIAIAVPLFALGVRLIPLTGGALAWTTGNVVLIGAMSALLGFFTGYFSGFGAWYAELFPTEIRSTAAGFCFNFGRVGAIAGIELVPALVPVLGFTATYCVAAVTYLAAAGLVTTLRETGAADLAT